jgi:hypothetical protein
MGAGLVVCNQSLSFAKIWLEHFGRPNHSRAGQKECPGINMKDAPLTRATFTPILCMLLLAFMADSGIAPLAAAETNTVDPRDFLMIKLYEATLKQVDALVSKAAQPSLLLSAQTSSNSQSSALASMIGDLYGCKPWLGIRPSTDNSSNVMVTLHNTIPGWNYRLWSKEQLVATSSWTLETNLVGASGQDWTQTTVPMNQRSNLFFYATVSGEFATNRSFAALQYTNSNIGNPDSMGAVGPDHFLEVLNAEPGYDAVAVFDKCSGQLEQRVRNADFFAAQYNGTNYPLGRTVDPRVLYDHQSKRWLACTLDNGSWNVLLAVSKGSNPLDLTNNWDKYVLPFARPGFGTDFPTLGLDAKGIYISTSTRPLSTGGYDGNLTLIIKKAQLYQQMVISNFINVPTNELPTRVIQPAVNFDPVPRGGWTWFVAKKDRQSGGSYQGGAVCYRRLAWSETNGVWTTTWAETNWVEVSNTPVYRDYFDLDEGGISAPQPLSAEGVPNSIEIYHTGSRLMMATIRDATLWTCQHVGLSETNGTYTGNDEGTNVNRSGIQWLKLSTDTNGAFLSMTNGRIYDATNADPRWYYCPSLAVNAAGDVVFGFSGSKSNEYVSAYYSWRTALGMHALRPVLLNAGHNALPSGQFGDYSSTSLDPADQMTFWTVQEYSDDPDLPNYWGTWITEIVPSPETP